MKFRMLLHMPKFPMVKQARIIVTCMALHNFIRESKLADPDFDPCDADENYVPLAEEASSEDELEPSTEEEQEEALPATTDMNDFRDRIADALFYN